jgi:hypothetical protein
MPIRMPTPDAIRKKIARAASESGGASVEHFLALLGPVELICTGSEGSWRLVYYLGSLGEVEAIESAVAAVHRSNPLVRVE